MIIPPFIKKGDTIGITATARKISKEELGDAIALIEEKGYAVKLSTNLFAEDNQFAGTDEQRANDLQELINDPAVKVIIIARGGYGSMRIADRIDLKPLQKNPKWLIGYSDITVWHSALHCHHIASLHATMPINFTKNKEATDTLFKFLEGQMMSYAYPISNPANRSLFVEGKATAPIIGGNLSLLYAMQGSITDIDTSGKILFIEDLDEYLYHIDRMIVSLKRAGKFEAIAGLIVGGMSDMKDNTVPFGKTAEQIIASHIKDAKFPVCYDFPCGHIDRNLSLPLGLTATLLVEHNQVSLTYTA